MPLETEPKIKIPKNHVPPNSEKYKVKDGDSWESIARRIGIDIWELIDFNFKTKDPREVNWYLHFYVGCNLPTNDKLNWRFSSSANPGIIYLPFRVIKVPEMVITGKIPASKSNLWLGIGEKHAGDLVALGYYNCNARVYRLEENEQGEIEWTNIVQHGLKLGGGLGGGVGLVVVFAHGIEKVGQFNSAFKWGDMDFDLDLGTQLGSALKGIKGIGKVVKTMEEYKKLNYLGKQFMQNRAFLKKGVYTIDVPFAGIGLHVWVGRKYTETFVQGSGTGI
jgi:hypothetical protein